MRRGGGDEQVQIVVLYLLWPWLTLATLMIFRASMRRAKAVLMLPTSSSIVALAEAGKYLST